MLPPPVPTPTPDRRPAGRPRPARTFAVIAVAAALAVLTGLGLGTLASRTFDGSAVAPPASPTTATASPSASVRWSGPSSPQSSALPPPSTPDAEASVDPEALRNSPLYDVRLAVDGAECDLRVRDPRRPLAGAALTTYLNDVVTCLTTSHVRPLARVGVDLQRPAVRTFDDRMRSPCGILRADAAPAYYCAANRTLYWPLDRRPERDAYSSARLGYIALAAHEYGHHLQAATGIIQAYAVKRADLPASRRDEFSRRLELQAQCFEGVFLAHARELLEVTGQDRYELRLWHSNTGDEDPPKGRDRDHGTSSAQIRWLFRGLDSGDFGRCNTWEAPRHQVR